MSLKALIQDLHILTTLFHSRVIVVLVLWW